MEILWTCEEKDGSSELHFVIFGDATYGNPTSINEFFLSNANMKLEADLQESLQLFADTTLFNLNSKSQKKKGNAKEIPESEKLLEAEEIAKAEKLLEAAQLPLEMFQVRKANYARRNKAKRVGPAKVLSQFFP